MGNVLSKIDSPVDQLFRFEEKILNAEAHLIKLRRSKLPKLLMFLTVLFIAIFGAIFNMKYLYLFIITPIILTLIILSNSTINKRRVRMAEYKLKNLKEEQKKFVKECKEDLAFSKTRRLIEKYEVEESRDTFFKTVIEKKKSGIDKITDFILANDPAKMNALICFNCGQHNGLIDPKNKEIEYFYCYSCKERNNRINEKVNFENKEEINK